MAKFDYIKFVTNHKHNNKPTPQLLQESVKKTYLKENEGKSDPMSNLLQTFEKAMTDKATYDQVVAELEGAPDHVKPKLMQMADEVIPEKREGVLELISDLENGDIDPEDIGAQETREVLIQQFKEFVKITEFGIDMIRKHVNESVNENLRTLQVTSENGRVVLITDPNDIEDFLAGEEVYGEDNDGGLIGVSMDSALDHQMAEGTCGYDTDAITGKKLTTPGGLKESAIKLGYLSEIKISRNIEIDIVDNDIMIKQGDKDFGKLVELNIAYIEGTDRLYRGYLHTENGQLNLSGGESGLFEFYDAVGAGREAEVEEFFSKYGVEITSSEFDVS